MDVVLPNKRRGRLGMNGDADVDLEDLAAFTSAF